MNRYRTYLLPPLFYIIVSWVGSMFTEQGLGEWYSSLNKPSFTPPGHIIGIVWTVIYTLTAISLIFFIRAEKGKPYFALIVGLYVFNGIINAAWSYIFFTKRLIGPAVLDAALIGLTVLVMIIMTWPSSKTASLLLLPYALWVSFATYLNYVIYTLN